MSNSHYVRFVYIAQLKIGYNMEKNRKMYHTGTTLKPRKERINQCKKPNLAKNVRVYYITLTWYMRLMRDIKVIYVKSLLDICETVADSHKSVYAKILQI